MCQSISWHRINVDNICTTNLSTPAKLLNNALQFVPDFCVHPWFMAFVWALLWKLYFPQLCVFCLSTEDPTERERIQQSAECCRKILNHVNEEVKVMENLLVRNTQSITQHTVLLWLSTNWTLANSFWDLWRSLLVRLLILQSRAVCPLSDHDLSLYSQNLKDYQRRLDTSGLKPSIELYTEYKVGVSSAIYRL